MCGEPIAPADRITSAAPHRPARSPRRGGRARNSNAGRELAVEQDAVDQRVRDELQVRPLSNAGLQIGARSAGAAAAAAGLLAPADAIRMAGRQGR